MNIINSNFTVNSSNPYAELASMGLQLTPPKTAQEMEETLKSLRQLKEKQLAHIQRLQQLAQKQLQKIGEQAKNSQTQLEADLKAIKAERDKEGALQAKMKRVFEQMKEVFKCPLCHETSQLPKVLSCGHTACQDCLRTYFANYFEKLKRTLAAPGDIKKATLFRRYHVYRHKCPLCKEEVIGSGFPVHPLKNIVQTTLKSGLISTEKAEQDFKVMEYSKTTPLEELLFLEQTKFYTQEAFGGWCHQNLIAFIARKQAKKGVLISFPLFNDGNEEERTLFGTVKDKMRSIPDTMVEVNSQKRELKITFLGIIRPEYPQGGFIKLESAQKAVSKLCTFARGAKLNMNWIKKNYVPQNPDKETMVNDLMTKMMTLNEAANKANEAINTANQIDPSLTLPAINSAIKFAFEAKNAYLTDYDKLPGNLHILIGAKGEIYLQFIPSSNQNPTG